MQSLLEFKLEDAPLLVVEPLRPPSETLAASVN